jgi:hypothetical protein
LEAAPLKKMRVSGWQATTIQLHSTMGLAPQSLPARKACYFALVRKDLPCEINVVVFVTDRGVIWAGPERDFYIETKSGIVGGKRDFYRILWCNNLMNRRRKEKADLDSVVVGFENEVDADSLVIDYKHGPTQTKEEYLNRATRLIDFVPDMFGSFRGGDIVAVQVEGNAVRLDLKGYKAGSSATVWIDIHSKKVMLANANGKQVYPELWRPW